ncbi:hypothetical protein NOVO_06350 [Rickettsiales bacterium Ac37b]|nr:hypothetical protein NOVO_06350 [Rickettsiales bacterium Ac37b]
MKTSEQIWKIAQSSPQTYREHTAMENGNYNIHYMLSHEQIEAAAFLDIAKRKNISFNDAIKQCFIDGFSIKGTTTISPDLMGIFFGESIENAINHTKKGTPAFLSLDDGKHFVLISLLPHGKNPNELSVLYTNSIPSDTTAKHFASTLVKYLQDKGINIRDNKYKEVSNDQQVGNCCGLSVATNIASIVTHYSTNQEVDFLKSSLFAPKDLEEKRKYYQNFGQDFFQKLNNPIFDHNKRKASLDDILKLTKNGHIDSAVDILRSINLTTKELTRSNLKLIQALEEIKQKAPKPIPLVEGYLDCIYSYNRKIGVDIKDYIREPLAKFTSTSITDQFLSSIPVSTNIDLTTEEELEFKKASEQAKEQPNLVAALKNLHNAAPLPTKSLLSKIIDYAKYILSSIKETLSSNVSQDTSHKFADNVKTIAPNDNQRSR